MKGFSPDQLIALLVYPQMLGMVVQGAETFVCLPTVSGRQRKTSSVQGQMRLADSPMKQLCTHTPLQLLLMSVNLISLPIAKQPKPGYRICHNARATTFAYGHSDRDTYRIR